MNGKYFYYNHFSEEETGDLWEWKEAKWIEWGWGLRWAKPYLIPLCPRFRLHWRPWAGPWAPWKSGLGCTPTWLERPPLWVTWRLSQLCCCLSVM